MSTPRINVSSITGSLSRRVSARCTSNSGRVWNEIDRNLASGLVSMVVVVLISACLSQPQWFWLEGGGCNTHSVGVYLFLYPGYFKAVEGEHLLPSSPHLIYYIDNQELKYCVTPNIVALLRIVIGMCFVIIWSAMIQLLLDVTGPLSTILTSVRKNAIPSIFSVLVCVAAVGLCYYITTLIEHQQETTKPLVGPNALNKVQVKFSIGFYLLLSGGALSVMAVACNWLRPEHIFQETGDHTRLMGELDDIDGLVGVTGGAPLPGLSYLHDIEPPPPLEGHPPPPYTP